MAALNMMNSEDIDRLILEQGMNLERNAFDSLTVDEETAITIREIELHLNSILSSGAAGDYAKLEETKNDLQVLKSEVGPRIAQL